MRHGRSVLLAFASGRGDPVRSPAVQRREQQRHTGRPHDETDTVAEPRLPRVFKDEEAEGTGDEDGPDARSGSASEYQAQKRSPRATQGW